jgi:hypothetical protein
MYVCEAMCVRKWMYVCTYMCLNAKLEEISEVSTLPARESATKKASPNDFHIQQVHVCSGSMLEHSQHNSVQVIWWANVIVLYVSRSQTECYIPNLITVGTNQL